MHSYLRSSAFTCGRIALLLIASDLRSETIDRIAVAVNNRAIKESQIDRDVRLTAFENGVPLDFSAASKRKAADRLIDQTVIRVELAKASYPAPAAAEIDHVLEKIKQARFRTPAEYNQALKTYGIEEPELKAHIAWQIQVLQFADKKFGNRANTAFFAWLDGSRKTSRIQFHDEAFE